MKRHSYGSALYWLKGRDITLRRYLAKFYDTHDWGLIKHFFYENPIQAKVILSDFQKSNEQKFNEVVMTFVAGKSKIVYIIGARDSGKTATAFKFAEEVHRRVGKIVHYVAPNINADALPSWCKTIKNIQDCPNGTFAIIDETAIQYNAREFFQKENIDMTKLLVIARHKDLFLIFITQSTALADTNIQRLRDILIWKKGNDYTMSEKGNKGAKESQFWQKVRNMMAPRTKEECLFEYPAQRRFIHFKHGLADCWSEELSKIWRFNKIPQKEEKEKEKVGLF